MIKKVMRGMNVGGYNGSSPCMKVNNGISEWFELNVWKEHLCYAWDESGIRWLQGMAGIEWKPTSCCLWRMVFCQMC